MGRFLLLVVAALLAGCGSAPEPAQPAPQPLGVFAGYTTTGNATGPRWEIRTTLPAAIAVFGDPSAIPVGTPLWRIQAFDGATPGPISFVYGPGYQSLAAN